MREKLIITGGAGRIGQHVVAALKDQHDITVLDLERGAHDGVDYRIADILDLDAICEAVRGADTILHLAAIDADSPAGMATLFDVNVRGSWNVFRAAELAGIKRVILCSSEAAIGGEVLWGDRPPFYLPIDEHHPLIPTTTYALSKQLKEEIGRNFARRCGMQVIVLRPSWVLFDGDLEEVVEGVEEEFNITDHRTLMGHDRDIPGVEPFASLRAYVTVEDTADAFVRALNMEQCEGFDVFNIAATDSFEAHPTLDFAARRFGHLPEVRRPGLYERSPNASMIDISRAPRATGMGTIVVVGATC